MDVTSEGSSVGLTVRAEGAGAIAVGGDAINSIFVTGGTNQFFVGQYERLVDAYLDPQSLYRELQLDRFTGRAWLVESIDAFIATVDRGYIVIEAEAGLGKTAFVAWLARERHLVHHFVRLMPDADDVGVALRSMAAQLIRAWDLQTRAVGGVLPPNAGRRDVFEQILFEAAQQRDAMCPEEPIIIVVDGLNETTAPSGHNPLALPADLPRGIYFVVTQRSVHVPLVVAAPRRVIPLKARSSDNYRDLRAHVTAAVADPDLRNRLAVAGIDANDFVHRLLEQCAGVWLVLRYVMAELRSGVRNVDDITSLPVGLWQYYASYWTTWQRTHADSWQTVDLPLLATITAVQEPVTLELLCDMAACPDRGRAASLVDDAWRPFLAVQEEPEERYAAFHDSLKEFVAGHVRDSDLTSAERSFVRRLKGAQTAAHDLIADRYLDAWGGVGAGLPHLESDTASMDDGYGLRHLVHHLIDANADPVLHGLLELERPREELADTASASPTANTWYETHRACRSFASYALDIERAWARAEMAAGDATAAPGRGGLRLELRYALISASVNSVAGNVPPELLLALIDAQLTTVEQSVELAREVTDARSRAEALTSLLPRLSGETRDETMREALASVQAIPDGYWRAGELVRLIPTAGPEHRDDLHRLADGMSRHYYRQIVRRALAGPEPQSDAAPDTQGSSSVDPADPAVFARQYLQRTRQAISTLSAGGGRASADEASVSELLLASSFVDDPRWRAQLLTASARSATPGAHADTLRAALGISLTVGDQRAIATALGSIAAVLARLGDVSTALACLAEVRDPEGRANALFTLAGSVTGRQEQRKVISMALDAVANIGHDVARGIVLRAHATQLAVVQDDARLEWAIASLTPSWRASVQIAAATDAGAAQRDELLRSALGTVLADTDAAGRSRVVVEFIRGLPLHLLPDAHTAIGELEDEESRDRAGAMLAVRLAQLSEAGPARTAIETLADPWWVIEARVGAARGLAACGQQDAAVAVASAVTSPPHRAEGLAAAGDLAAAHDVADAARDPLTRVAVLLRIGSVVGVTQARPPEPRDWVEEARAAFGHIDAAAHPSTTAAVADALAAAGRWDDAVAVVRPLADIDRGPALRVLARHVADENVEAAIIAARDLVNPGARGRTLACLTSAVVSAHPSDLQRHIREVLHLLSTGTRTHMLAATSDLIPGLMALVGPAGLVDMAAAVAAAYRWWP